MVATYHFAENTREDASLWAWLTVERAIYLGIALLAAGIRLFALGRWPLLDGEAAIALAAWRAQGGGWAYAPGLNPLLVHGNALLFFAFGASDMIARALPLLCGVYLVALPYALRKSLGASGAIAASALLALSASLIFTSRTADGAIFVVAAALGLLAAVYNYMETRESGYLYLGAISLALGLMAGPGMYSVLLIVTLFAVFLYWRARAGDETWARLVAAGREAAASGAWRQPVLVGLAFLLLWATAFALNPAGIQMTIDQFGQWLGHFARPTDQPWYAHFTWLLLYEPLPLIFGLYGLYLVFRERDFVSTCAAFWFVVALVFHSLPGYQRPEYFVLIVAPLTLLAGKAIGRLVDELGTEGLSADEWLLLAITLVLLFAARIRLGDYLFTMRREYLLRGLALLLLLVASYALFWNTLAQRIWRVILLSLLALTLALSVKGSVDLNFKYGRDPREPFVAVATSPDVLNLVHWVEEISQRRAKDPHVIGVTLQKDLEIPLAWYLRDFADLSFANNPIPSPATPVVIAPADAGKPAKYLGLRFALRTRWMPGSLSAVDRVKWLLWRDAVGGLSYENVELWVQR